MNSNQAIETGNFGSPGRILWPRARLRLVDWNIDRGLKLADIIEFLESANADLILLQEADINARRAHHLNVACEIARKLSPKSSPFRRGLGDGWHW